MITRMGVPFAEAGRQCVAQLKHLLPLAEKLGVTVLVGTDEHPASYADEVAMLRDHGLSPKAALAAASDSARAYFGGPKPHWLCTADTLALFASDGSPQTKYQDVLQDVEVGSDPTF